MSENKSKKGTPAASDWSDEEKAAMKERAKELREEKSNRSKASDEQAVMDKIGEMPEVERVIALRLHEMIKQEFPDLHPKTWYGMPAYQLGGKTLVFFQSAHKFGSRYSTLGFSDTAKLDDGTFWATSFALVALNSGVEAQIRDLIGKAIS
jgi:uncharacterized protein YdhG (YjbR/CyaY superfamily)